MEPELIILYISTPTTWGFFYSAGTTEDIKVSSAKMTTQKMSDSFYNVVEVVLPCNCEMQNRREDYMDDDQLV